MKRRGLRVRAHAALLVGAAAAGAAGCEHRDEGAAPSLDQREQALELEDVTFIATELLGRPTQDSVVLNAITAEAIEAWVEYGTSPGARTESTPQVTYADGVIELTVSGLEPDTRYYYALRFRPSGSTEEALAGEEHTFHTQRAPSSSFSFVVQADSHHGFDAFHSSELYGITMDNIAADQPDFLVDVGDTFSLDSTSETVASVSQKYLDQRDFFGIVAHSAPIFLALGNHENEEGWNLDDFGSNRSNSLPVLGANARKRYFLNPIPDAFYGGNSDPLPELDGDDLREDYYAFEWGEALFVVIDPFAYTMTKPYSGGLGGERNDEVVGNRWSWTLGRQQYDFLKETLENSDRKFKFLFTHHLVGGTENYSRGGAAGAKYVEWGGYEINGTTWGFGTQRPGWEKPIHQLLVDTGVSVVYHAHDHIYAKESLDGVVYQEVPHAANDDYGTGFAINQTNYANAERFPNSGYLRVTVTPSEVSSEYVRSFLPGDGVNGSVAHTYSIANCTDDTDGDGVDDCVDGCPDDPSKTAPGVCGCGVSEQDADGDGTPDCNDGCPDDATKLAPGVCGCGVPDSDGDGDGTPSCNDGCPQDPAKVLPGACGCGVSDADGDGDGTANCNDACPADAGKVTPGSCGCGVSDADDDGDGTPNCNDGCPNDASKVAPGLCGCGFSDQDGDGDGVLDCNDLCPDDAAKTEPGACGCGVSDADGDGDGTANCEDLCPTDPDKFEPGACGCGNPEEDEDADGVPDCVDPGPCGPGDSCPVEPDVVSLVALGKQVFFDPLSQPAGVQGCVTCHVPETGFTHGDEAVNLGQVVGPGAAPGAAGNRKPPTAAYAAFSRNFTPCGDNAFLCRGGIFWDGRARGDAIGAEVFAGEVALQSAYQSFLGPTADQALGPFANPVEQNLPAGNTELPGAEAVCDEVQAARYAPLYELAWGEPLDCSALGADLTFKRIALAVSAFEHSEEVNSFSSRRDQAIANDADGEFPLDDFTDQENLGHDLFFGTALCFTCHAGVPTGDATSPDGNEPRQLYTNQRFAHIGLPPNPDAANFDPNDADTGLAEVTGNDQHEGSFRIPSLRNVDTRPDAGFTKAFMHNGYFKSLEQVVHFYNTAIAKPFCTTPGLSAEEAIANECWPAAEVDNGLQASLAGFLGDLGMSEAEEAALVAYLRTLTDTVVVEPPGTLPIAEPQSFQVLVDTTTTLDLLEGVSDPEGDIDPASLVITSSPNSGTLVDNGDGSVDYTPNAGFLGDDEFEFQICDLGGNCATGPVSIEVVAQQLGVIEFGTTTATGAFSTVQFENPYTDPVVVTSANLASNTTPVVVRVRNVGPTSFELRLQNPSDGAVVAEQVSYVVVERGTWEVDGHRFEAQTYTSTVTDSDTSWAGQVQAYGQTYVNPVVVGQVMTQNDPDWSVFWSSSNTATNPPTAAQLRTGKHVGEDGDTSRSNETVGFIVFEANHGILDGMEFEARLGTNTVRGVGDAPPYFYNFTSAFDTAPTAAVASVAGMNGTNGAWAQLHGPNPLSSTRFALSVDEDQVQDTERQHATEEVAYLAFGAAQTAPVAGDDSFAVDQDTTSTLALLDNDNDPNGDLDPGSLFVTLEPGDGTVTDNGDGTVDYTPDAGFVGADSFEYQICDADGECDVALVTIDVLATSVMEFGTVSVGGAFTTVNLERAYVDPVVVCTASRVNNTAPFVVRVRNALASSFQVRLQNPSDAAVVAETVHYLVVEAGVWEVDGRRFEAAKFSSTVTDSDTSWVGQVRSYGQTYANPVVIGQVMTQNDPDWSVFWASSNTASNPPTATQLRTGKHVGEDSDTTRSNETIGYVVFNSGHGTIAGIEVEAVVGANSIQGVADSPPDSYSFQQAFAGVPGVVVVSPAGMNGTNGGWAQLHGAGSVSATGIGLSFDEDQVSDSERNHTAEQVSYVALRRSN